MQIGQKIVIKTVLLMCEMNRNFIIPLLVS